MRRKDGRYALAFVVVRVPGCNVLSGGCSTSWQGEEKEEEDEDEDEVRRWGEGWGSAGGGGGGGGGSKKEMGFLSTPVPPLIWL
jgi:hypothetical protein